ncbi:MAG TPA: DUF1800 domain-containing protein [Acidimicrobiales bacterium]
MTDDELGDASATVTGGRARWRRRTVIAGLASTGVGVAALGATRILPSTGDAGPRPGGDGVRRPADADGFANRDESYASALASTERISASRSKPPRLLFDTAGEAAAATDVAAPTILDTSDPVLHLLRRTTFGPTPALVDEAHAAGIDAWLTAQLSPAGIDDPQADAVVARLPLALLEPGAVRAAIPRGELFAAEEYARATLARQIWSRRQLLEVMTDFWANHLNVTTPSNETWDNAASWHEGVIRKHALGSFTDMLLAAMRNPAMLRYLTNVGSRKDAVNENLGRELLELHTVGVASGYTEDDVRNSAHILTGRTVANDRGPGVEGDFVYDPELHWTGPVTVLDFTHPNDTPEGGLEVGDAYLRHLAAHPATAQTVARKLAVRFVSDMPPRTLVDRLAETYLAEGTAIVPVLSTLFRSAEFWAAAGQKVRRPLDDAVGSARVLGVEPAPEGDPLVHPLLWWSGQMGQRPLAWRSPNGYPEVHAAWRSASGRLTAWNYHRALVMRWDDVPVVPPEELVADRPQATVGEYVDSLCQRLCLQTFEPEHRDALIAFVGADAATPVAESTLPDMVRYLVPLVLDSPYFLLR